MRDLDLHSNMLATGRGSWQRTRPLAPGEMHRPALALVISARFAALHESLWPISAEGRMSGFECLADLIIDGDGVSACDAGYVCFLCAVTVDMAPRVVPDANLSSRGAAVCAAPPRGVPVAPSSHRQEVPRWLPPRTCRRASREIEVRLSAAQASPKRQLRIAAFVTAIAAIVTRPSGHGESCATSRRRAPAPIQEPLPARCSAVATPRTKESRRRLR